MDSERRLQIICDDKQGRSYVLQATVGEWIALNPDSPSGDDFSPATLKRVIVSNGDNSGFLYVPGPQVDVSDLVDL